MPPGGIHRTADAAWITIRDSALLPIMPKFTVDNAWKIDVTDEAMAMCTARTLVGTIDEAAGGDRRQPAAASMKPWRTTSCS